MTLLRLFVTISLRRINEDDLNERDDHGVPFSERQYTHGSFYISLSKCNPFDQSDPTEWPQILDIYSVVVLLSVNVVLYLFAPVFASFISSVKSDQP